MICTLREAYNLLLKDPSKAFWVDPYSIKADGEQSPVFLVERISNGSTEQKFIPSFVDIVPGSFNPIHEAHRWIYNNIENDWKAYEMSITKVDKPAVSVSELVNRIKQFDDEEWVLLTNAPRMIEKCAAMDGIHLNIHIGIDTIVRMATDYTAHGIAGLKGRFTVYDRMVGDKLLVYPPEGWTTLPSNVVKAAKQLPDNLKSVSSTAIREQQKESLREIEKRAYEMAKEKVEN